LYTKFLDEQLTTYYDENLENDFSDFANVMEEYRDGLLLFDLMEKEIWDRAKTDTIGLKNFYDQHKMEHMWKKRIEVTVASSTKEEMIKKAQALLKKNTEPQAIKDKLNVNDIVNVMTNSGTFEEGSDALPKTIKYKLGVSEVFKEGEYYFVTNIKKIIPEGEKTLEECKGKIVNEYQQNLEQHWVDDLKKEFTITINTAAFEGVKNKLK
jgi:peptidyl-prolyl cis-trans isomerase SurA